MHTTYFVIVHCTRYTTVPCQATAAVCRVDRRTRDPGRTSYMEKNNETRRAYDDAHSPSLLHTAHDLFVSHCAQPLALDCAFLGG